MERPVCLADFEVAARHKLSRPVYDFIASGANDEITLGENISAFRRYRLRPRCLVDVSKITMNTTLLGHPVNFPVGVAPFAIAKMYHHEGEIGVVRACENHHTCFIQSTVSCFACNEIAEAAPDCLKWHQLYFMRNRSATLEIVRRAEQNDFKAIVVTVDSPKSGRRIANMRNKFQVPSDIRINNLETIQVLERGFAAARKAHGWDILTYLDKEELDPSLTWEDLTWLKKNTKLPMLVKGILTGEDAEKSISHGASGIFVSNHGARQLDGVPATIDALPEVVRAVNGRCEVYLDGGVRTGTDVIKALGLGARAVFVGRPAAYGLAYDGMEGVSSVLQILKEELGIAMACAGVPSIHEIPRDLVVHESFYKSRL